MTPLTPPPPAPRSVQPDELGGGLVRDHVVRLGLVHEADHAGLQPGAVGLAVREGVAKQRVPCVGEAVLLAVGPGLPALRVGHIAHGQSPG
eukprot:CAMPEP_0173210858 /NCGR_PEP_ID=MMETSP1141-20130122/23904_1 /TAXON_ID=483371 /ORGANISM="non described non described, Strain CCMP2298" /LENGTH=90 /DNA_ID=CAMNT_0014137665 /DNA_START=98 /DNA_END=367 /DNA_ORIENTATION=+